MVRFVLIVFIFIFGVNVTAAGDVSQFVFTTEPQTIKPNEISQKITIQAQDASGNPANLAQTTCLELKTTPSTGEFSFSDANWSPIERLTMSKGSANRNFYYKNPTEGVYEMSVNVSFRPEGENSSCASWPIENWDIRWKVKQNITVSSSQNPPPPDNPPPDNSQQQPAAGPTGGASWPIEEQIFANAGEDKTTVAGADLAFSGKALGLEKEPLENARYSWNFGDGASSEGQNVRHFYKYPGNYIVVLDVSSGKFSASDRLNVKAVPNELQIIEADKNLIKIKNNSNVLLDVSGWFLRAPNNQIFMFPASSLMGANSDLIISSNVSKVKLNNNNTVELLYPNGSVAFVYEEKVVSENPAPSIPTPTPTPPQPVKYFAPTVGPVFETNATATAATAVATTTSSEQENQLANVIAVVDKKDFMKGKWIFLAIALGLFAAAGLFLIRRYGDIASK